MPITENQKSKELAGAGAYPIKNEVERRVESHFTQRYRPKRIFVDSNWENYTNCSEGRSVETVWVRRGRLVGFANPLGRSGAGGVASETAKVGKLALSDTDYVQETKSTTRSQDV